jgi:hypothetical protein
MLRQQIGEAGPQGGRTGVDALAGGDLTAVDGGGGVVLFRLGRSGAVVVLLAAGGAEDSHHGESGDGGPRPLRHVRLHCFSL